MIKNKTLVIGASLKLERYSNKAIRKLLAYDQPVVALGLRAGEIEGVVIETEKKIFPDIETVTMYLNPQRQEEYYEYILNLKPRRVIFNPGTENSQFFSLLEAANIYVEIACTLVLLATDQYQAYKSEESI